LVEVRRRLRHGGLSLDRVADVGRQGRVSHFPLLVAFQCPDRGEKRKLSF
jgi:hypothetical protein